MTFPDDPVHPDGGNRGMTIREYMATHILAGMGGWHVDKTVIAEAARSAVVMADALIDALDTKE